MIDQSLTFYTGAYHLIGGGGKLRRLPLPESADLAGFYAGRILFTLRDAWEVAGQTFPEGALLAIDAAAFRESGELPASRPFTHRTTGRASRASPFRAAAFMCRCCKT